MIDNQTGIRSIEDLQDFKMSPIIHTICVKPVAVNGVKIFDDLMQDATHFAQITCVLALKKDKSIRSKSSLPLRNSRDQASCSARWYDERDADMETSSVSFDTKMHKSIPKDFEFSIFLRRGMEEIEIGSTSLTFTGVLLQAELDIPINQVFLNNRMASNKSSKRRGIFGSRRRMKKSTSIENLEKLPLNEQSRIPCFRGGDGGRSYTLVDGATIRVMVSYHCFLESIN